MDEKARIFRVCVWFRPIQPPIRVEEIARRVSKVVLRDCDVRRRSVIGGSFIRVESSRAVIREEPWSTSGNQKWNGTSPNLIAIAIVNIRHDVGWFSCVMSHCPVDQALVMLEKRIRADAVDWVRKYLIVASITRGWCDLEMRGMMAKVLISKPVQAKIQWLLEIVMLVPMMRLTVQISFAWGFISRGRG